MLLLYVGNYQDNRTTLVSTNQRTPFVSTTTGGHSNDVTSGKSFTIGGSYSNSSSNNKGL